MAYKYGRRSTKKLSTAHPLLQVLMYTVVPKFDNSVIWGWRGEEVQAQAFESGNSEKQWPESKHNFFKEEGPESKHNFFKEEGGEQIPEAWALDVGPYNRKLKKVDWDDVKSFRYFAGHIKAHANLLGIQLRWGGDWDRDNDASNQKLMDLAHIELVSDVRSNPIIPWTSETLKAMVGFNDVALELIKKIEQG